MCRSYTQSHSTYKNVYTDKRLDQFVCPVCKKVLGSINLPDKETIVDDELYDWFKGRFFQCSTQMRYPLVHGFNEETGSPLADPHTVMMVIEMVFNSVGECIVFGIVDIVRVSCAVVTG